MDPLVLSPDPSRQPVMWNRLTPATALLALALVAPLEARSTEPTMLDKALEAVIPEHLSVDLHFLASDAMRGRDTPSPELRIAAEFLASRAERLGFQPGAEHGFYQDYPLYQRYLDSEASGITLSSTKGERGLEIGRDYYLYNGTHLRDLDLTGEVVCVGDGSRSDFEGVEVKGRWVLAMHEGRPLGSVARRAEKGGALGLIATPGPGFKSKPYAERYGRSAEAMKSAGRARFSPPRKESKFPQLMLDSTGAEALYALSPETWAEGGPPVGQSLGVKLHEVRKVIDPVISVSNVCAFWPGKEGARADEVMILSAHYDHIGARGDDIYNGADDNASGTVGLLGLAEALVAYGPMERSVLLLWVSGEEKGLWGSEVWSENPWLPEGCRPVFDINVDMIGRTKPDELYITPSREHQAFNSVAQAAYELSSLEGFPELQEMDSYWRRSDHYNFYKNLEIPVIFLSSGDHPDYHKPTDTAEKIDFDKMARSVRLVVRLLDRVQGESLEK